MRSSDIIAGREREYRRLELLFITLVIINGTVMADDELSGGARRNFIRIRASFVDSINFVRLSFSSILAMRERGGEKKGKTQKVERYYGA